VENIAHGAEPDDEQAKLGLRMQTPIFSQWRVGRGRRKPGDEPINGGRLIFNLDAQAGGEEREAGGKLPQPGAVFFRGDEGCGSRGAGSSGEALEAGGGVRVVVREGGLDSESEAGRREALKELFRAGDAAKGGDGGSDGGNLHLAVQPPDGTDPARNLGVLVYLDDFAQTLLDFRLVRGNGKDRGALECVQGLAQVARRKQTVCQVVSIEQQNVDVAMELAVLKAVVEQVDTGPGYLRGKSPR
jgi:hypothetical protein